MMYLFNKNGGYVSACLLLKELRDQMISSTLIQVDGSHYIQVPESEGGPLVRTIPLVGCMTVNEHKEGRSFIDGISARIAYSTFMGQYETEPPYDFTDDDLDDGPRNKKEPYHG